MFVWVFGVITAVPVILACLFCLAKSNIRSSVPYCVVTFVIFRGRLLLFSKAYPEHDEHGSAIYHKWPNIDWSIFELFRLLQGHIQYKDP